MGIFKAVRKIVGRRSSALEARDLEIYARDEHVEFGIAPFAINTLTRAVFR